MNAEDKMRMMRDYLKSLRDFNKKEAEMAQSNTMRSFFEGKACGYDFVIKNIGCLLGEEE